MIQVNRIYLIFNRLVTKKFLVDTSDITHKTVYFTPILFLHIIKYKCFQVIIIKNSIYINIFVLIFSISKR